MFCQRNDEMREKLKNVPHHHQPGISAILVKLSFELVGAKNDGGFFIGLLVVTVGLPGKAKLLPPCGAVGWNADPPKIFQFCGLPTAPKSRVAPPVAVGRAKLLSAWLKIPPINPSNALPPPICFPVGPAGFAAAAAGACPAGRVRDESSPNASLAKRMV